MQKKNVIDQQNAQKPEWRTPTLRTMKTSDAESGTNANNDGGGLS